MAALCCYHVVSDPHNIFLFVWLLVCSVRDFEVALKTIKSSVSQNDLKFYEDWNRQFGSFKAEGDDENAMDKDE